jgi:hypothetical protein
MLRKHLRSFTWKLNMNIFAFLLIRVFGWYLSLLYMLMASLDLWKKDIPRNIHAAKIKP